MDMAFGVAGDDAVADGCEGGAQLLLGLKDLFGTAAENVEGSPVGIGDGVQAIAREQADGDADAEGEHKQEPLHMANLMLPKLDTRCATMFCVVSGIGEVAADVVHHRLSAEVEID